MECFSGKPSSFVPVSRRSLMISMRIKRLHERCTRHWPGMCAMLTALSLDCSHLILRMDPLPQAWWKPTPRRPASAPLLPYAPPGRGSGRGTLLCSWAWASRWCCHGSHLLSTWRLLSGSSFPFMGPDGWKMGIFNLVILFYYIRAIVLLKLRTVGSQVETLSNPLSSEISRRARC